VGRSSPSNNTRFHDSNQFYQVNNILFWGTAQHHHRQWEFYVQRVQKLLREDGNQIEVRIRGAPKDEWTSRKSQWDNMQWYKKEVVGTLEKAKHA
jgi:hypothetical protein